jgi:hypothetical protein
MKNRKRYLPIPHAQVVDRVTLKLEPVGAVHIALPYNPGPAEVQVEKVKTLVDVAFVVHEEEL